MPDTRLRRVRYLAAYIGTLAFIGFIAASSGCASRSSPYSTLSEAQRDSTRAQRLTQAAVEIAAKDPAKAELLLRDALAADLYHGPAHNNLGVLYLKKDPPMFYEAASEFEWARKLMPGHPDPRLNLAIVLEQAGRTDEALSTYAAALEVYPNYLPALQGLARLQLRSGKPDASTDAYLNEIALRADTSEWREWAQTQLIKRGEPREAHSNGN